jgi:hypothetical protein
MLFKSYKGNSATLTPSNITASRWWKFGGWRRGWLRSGCLKSNQVNPDLFLKKKELQ